MRPVLLPLAPGQGLFPGLPQSWRTPLQDHRTDNFIKCWGFLDWMFSWKLLVFSFLAQRVVCRIWQCCCRLYGKEDFGTRVCSWHCWWGLCPSSHKASLFILWLVTLPTESPTWITDLFKWSLILEFKFFVHCRFHCLVFLCHCKCYKYVPSVVSEFFCFAKTLGHLASDTRFVSDD